MKQIPEELVDQLLDGFDEQVIALYARGLSPRDVRPHLEELYPFG